MALLPYLGAANKYIASATSSPAGSNSNDGSIGAPWLTLAYAVAHISCGDTINVVADGHVVAGDVDLPYIAACASTTTIQSTLLGSFLPIGYRTNPTRDASFYGTLELTSTGIRALSEGHGSSINGGLGFLCVITNLTTNTITMGCNGAGLPVLANGMQVEFEVISEGNPLATAPTGFSLLTKYYVVNCSSSPTCGTNGSTFQIATTSGGSAISGLGCSGTCTIAAVVFTAPLQVTAGSANIVMGDSPVAWAVNTPIAFTAAGFQDFGTLPAPLALNTPYYITSVSTKTIQVSTTLGGSAVTITAVGTGPLYASNTNVASQWAFRGLKTVDGVGSYVGTMMQFGGNEASNTVGVINNIEVDRSYIVSQNNASEVRGIADNAATTNYHDNYIASFSAGEAQAISGWASPGPTLITNNFLEASGEIILYGGNYPRSGAANANKMITGNFGYKPPTWRFQSDTGPASGGCLYDNTDPLLTGGEWYTDTNTGIKYRCGSGGTWATTASTYPDYGSPLVKTGFEHKNGKNITYIGNIGNYNWGAAQSGQWFNNSEEYGSGPGMADDHITIQNNAIYNVYQFGNRITVCGLTLVLPCINNAHDHTTVNNLVVTNPLTCGVGFATGGVPCGYQPYQGTTLGGDGTNPTVLAIPFQTDVNNHNTIYAPDSGWPRNFPNPMFSSSPTAGCPLTPVMNLETYTNSIIPGNFTGDCYSGGDILSTIFSNSTFSNNALLKGSSGIYGSPGATNTWAFTEYPATNSFIKYLSADGTINGDYRLDPTSPYSAAGGCSARCSTDGTDLGADVEAVMAAISGVRGGTPTWAVRESFSISVGSTTATATYDRPGATACSMTIYNAPARITANENADTNTSGKRLDTRAGNTVVGSHVTFVLGTNSALTPLTQYWYKLSCVAADSSTWLLAGDSFTTTSGSSLGSRISGQIKFTGGAVIH